MDSDQQQAWVHEWLHTNDLTADQDGLDMETIAGMSNLHQRLPQLGDDSDSDAEYGYSSGTSSEDDEPPQLVKADSHRRKKISGDNEHEDLNKQFLYNGRVALISIPGILLVLSLASDLLLTVTSIGSFIIYLLQTAGEVDKAAPAFLVTFICAHLTVIYSTVPLLWKSLTNIVLVFCINIFSTLTGGWIMIGFPLFRNFEPDLVKFVESSLFSMYPGVCVVLVTWFIVLLTSVHLAPYCLMIIGFIIMQAFLVPTLSSFTKNAQGDSAEDYVLHPSLVAAIAAIFCTCVPGLFLVIRASEGIYNFIAFSTVIEWVFLASSCAFLSTFFNLRQFMEISGIDYKHMTVVRWSTGFISLLLLSPLLSCYDVQSTLLPWLPGVAIAFAAYGLVLLKKNKAANITFGSLLAVLLAAAMIIQLPWKLDYALFGYISIQWLYFLVAMSALLGVVCVYGSVHFPQDAFGLLLLLQSLCECSSEILLLHGSLCSSPVLLITGAGAVYLCIKLYQTGHLLWQHSLLVLSLHLSKCMHCVSTLQVSQQGAPAEALNFLLSWQLVAILCYIFVFENRSQLKDREVLIQAGCLCVSILMTAPGLLYRLATLLAQEELSASALCGIVGSLVCICIFKWSYCHQWQQTVCRLVLPIAMVTSITLVVLQPQMTLSWSAAQEWLMVLSVLITAGMVPVLSQLRQLHVTVSLLGIPVGLTIALIVFPERWTWSLCLLYSATATLCVDIALQAWTQGTNYESRIMRVSYGLCGIGMAGILWDVITYVPMDTPTWMELEFEAQPGLLMATGAALWVACTLKVWSLSGQTITMTVRGVSQQSPLPLFGNLATLTTFVLLVANKAVAHWEIWVCICSAVFLLLQKDHKYLRTLTRYNNLCPLLISLTLVLQVSTVTKSTMWTFSDALTVVCGFLEIGMVLATFPSMIVFLLAAWNPADVPRDADKVIIFLSPLSTLLIFVWSSYSALGLAFWCVVTSIWTVNVVMVTVPK